MAIWADQITLIAQTEPAERINAAGFPNELVETARAVFCNKKNVGYAEYFSSQQAGRTVSLKVEVHTVDYNDETIAEFKGKRYSIPKTYEIDDDTIELTLTDLREQASESEG